MSLWRENIFAPVTIREGDEDTERGWAWEGNMKRLEERGEGESCNYIKKKKRGAVFLC